MDVTVARAAELTAVQRSQWAAFQAADAGLASPFFHPEFTMAVASVRDDVHVAVIEDGGAIAGFLPFQRGRRPVGAPVGGARSNYHGVIAADGAGWDGAELVRKAGLRIWDFHHLPVSQPGFTRFHASTGESYCVDVSDGFAAYAANRRQGGSRMVRRVREKMRRLERDVGPLRLEPHIGDAEVLHMVMRWKSDQYRRTGHVDNFAVDWNVRLLERLQRTDVDGFGGMLVGLYAGDTLAAVDMGLRCNHVFHSWFPAYNDQLARYSPGLVQFLLLLEQAEALGLGLIDLGKDHALYKERLATHLVPLAQGSVLVPSATASARRARRAVEGAVTRTPLVAPARRAAQELRAFRARHGILTPHSA
jgi:CelD/BcsL family acetyltransferase involved in cellulose biosynthesis